MQVQEARAVLGFPPNSHPTPSEVKASYRKKVWESHPDLFPVHEKPHAERKFKLISEAYTCLQSGAIRNGSATVVTTGVPRTQGGKRNQAFIVVPFLLIVTGTVALGGLNASRAYKRQKETCRSYNPFLP